MAVSYKKLWHILVDRNMKKKDLEEAAGITHYQMYNDELEQFWHEKRNKLLVVRFIVVGTFSKKVTLNYLWGKNIVGFPNGPRSFDLIDDAQFDSIVRESATKFYIARGQI